MLLLTYYLVIHWIFKHTKNIKNEIPGPFWTCSSSKITATVISVLDLLRRENQLSSSPHFISYNYSATGTTGLLQGIHWTS